MGEALKSILVVVSHYNARPAGPLLTLLDSMSHLPAGRPFSIRIVVNQEIRKPLILPDRHRGTETLYRENTGYNIGAWEFGWRLSPAHDAYLFLQDECRIVRAGWLEEFARPFEQSESLGLLGESFSPEWDAPWTVLGQVFRSQQMPGHLIDGRPADRVTCYLHHLNAWGIPVGERADHLQSLILFTSRTVLDRIGGFDIGLSYGEAIAAEIAISKKVQALGLRIRQIHATPFYYVEHPQWLHRRRNHEEAGDSLSAVSQSASACDSSRHWC